ncbi:CCHC-type domain-containing protein [Trichonephila clavipes]|nr:CCHC-type domain-containing protein [Trichonephila clavipes]
MEEPIDLPRSAWEDPLKWLKEYDRVANFNKWDDMMCLANVYFFLDGTARQWYVNNEDALDSWEAFKNGLSGLFGDRQRYTRRAEEQTKMPSPAFRREYTVLHTKCIRLCQEVNPLMRETKSVTPNERRELVDRDLKGFQTSYRLHPLTDETDLVSLIRTIVREEVHRLVNQTQESLDSDPQSLEEIVQDEVERVLAPVSTKPTETRPRPTYAAVTRKYRAPVQKFPPQPRKTDRKAVFDNLETADGTSTTLALKKKYADQTLLAVLRQVPREADPQYVVTDPRRHIADPVSRQAVGARKTKQSDLPRSHDVILGWDFLEASQAVIDCGQNELVLEDICRDSTAPDAWNLYATRDYTLKPHSLTRITVSGYQIRGDINVVLDGSKHLLFEKNIATPSMVSTYRNGKVMSGLPTCSSETKSSLEECIGQAEPLK